MNCGSGERGTLDGVCRKAGLCRQVDRVVDWLASCGTSTSHPPWLSLWMRCLKLSLYRHSIEPRCFASIDSSIAVFLAVVVSRLTYASPAWSGFITATDRQRADAFLRRSKRCGFCPPDLPEFDELLEKSDDELFNKTINNPNHTLHQFLPYSLRHRSTTTSDTVPTIDYYHSIKDNCFTAIFITRLLYKNMY